MGKKTKMFQLIDISVHLNTTFSFETFGLFAYLRLKTSSFWVQLYFN